MVIGVDPSVTSKKTSNETGIIAAGVARHVDGTDHGYILDDLSLIASPDGWAKIVVDAYKDQQADRVVAEVNNGGDLVEVVIRTIDKTVSYKAVHATRGKAKRAEPIAALRLFALIVE